MPVEVAVNAIAVAAVDGGGVARELFVMLAGVGRSQFMNGEKGTDLFIRQADSYLPLAASRKGPSPARCSSSEGGRPCVPLSDVSSGHRSSIQACSAGEEVVTA